MLFQFLKYITPTWYYNLFSEQSNKVTYFVDYRCLSEKEQSLLDICYGYHTQEAICADAAYQAFQKGLVRPSAKSIDVTHSITGVEDNYVFIRRYFSPIYSWYVLLLRLISIHNPLNEIKGFLQARTVSRVNVYHNTYFDLEKERFELFHSNLVDAHPFVSIIIPTLNRYEYLRNVLKDLELQDYPFFEVIICDQTDNLDESFYRGWHLDIKLIKQKEKALWQARNRSIKEAKGKYVLLFDDDSRVDPDWISQHLRCLDFYHCDISSGVSLSKVGDKIPKHYSYFLWSSQIDTGNVLFAKELMKDTGMFDRQFEKQRAGDGEFGLRAYLSGKTNISNPYAKRVHLKVPSGGLRQMGSWDSFRPKKIWAPRPVPSVLYLSRHYFGNHLSRLMLLQNIPTSLTPYRWKGKKWAVCCSVLVLVLLFSLIILQVIVSWHKASIMLQQGARIESL